MTMLPATPKRRPDVEQAFNHLFSLFGSVDLTRTDPSRHWLVTLRHLMKSYGNVGEAPSLSGIRIIPVSADGVSAEWVLAEGGSARHRIVYLHGGGWCAGAPADYRALTAALARFSGAAVLAVDYRLAPEHPFPAGLEDCCTALAWAGRNGPDAAPDREAGALSISLIGDSAGGNLAAAACAAAIIRGGRIPDRLVLIAGVLDGVHDPERIGLDDPICPPESIASGIKHYLGEGAFPTDPLISPVYLGADVLQQFPPTLLQASSAEALLRDAKRFASLLERAGARVNLSIWPALPHVWHAFLGLFPEAPEALQEVAGFVRPPAFGGRRY
jgi:acetyl esterase/lipase